MRVAEAAAEIKTATLHGLPSPHFAEEEVPSDFVQNLQCNWSIFGDHWSTARIRMHYLVRQACQGENGKCSKELIAKDIPFAG